MRASGIAASIKKLYINALLNVQHAYECLIICSRVVPINNGGCLLKA